MPPRTRTRATKDLKENVNIGKKIKLKSDGKVTKPPRKALADKTNSLSDDNASIDVPIKSTKVASINKAAKIVCKGEVRPRRERKLPTRYIANDVLNNLSNSKDTPVKNPAIILNDKKPSKNDKSKQPVTITAATNKLKKLTEVEQPVTKIAETNKPTKKLTEVEVKASRPKRNCRIQSVIEVPASKGPDTPDKLGNSISTPFKTPIECDTSLVVNRPRRISRLPLRFEDHSISPNKFIPLQPCHASTPLVQKPKLLKNNGNVGQEKSLRDSIENHSCVKRTGKILTKKGKELKKTTSTKGIELYFSKSSPKKNGNISSSTKISPDTNNNPKGIRVLPKRAVSIKSPAKKTSPKATNFAKRLVETSLSFRVFEDRKEEDKNEDVYEFTYDPKEEPAPQKKKRKKPVKKRPAKPKTVVFKNNYEDNVAKALETLKSKVKPAQPQSLPKPPQTLPKLPQSLPKLPQSIPNQQSLPTKAAGKVQIIEDIIIKPAAEPTLNHTPANDTGKNSVHMSNYASINVDDIAADFESIGDDKMNYSPVYSPENSPCHKTPAIPTRGSHINKDPLNLQGDMSFFDEQPVASSSMNVSARLPIASPWRVEFGNLPIRWQANTYVKANMTPAVDSSFINSEEINQKKHVYTNIACEPLPQTEEPNLKQTSIISFMRECAEKSNKKKRDRPSPKSNSALQDDNFGYNSPKKAKKDKYSTTNVSNDSNKPSEKENSNKENSNEQNSNHEVNENSKENSNQSESPRKKSNKKKDGTFFGFDESESFDQENVSPIKNVRHTRARGLRPKSRNVLQEINAVTGPSRAVLPVSVKASSDVVNKLYDQMKSDDAQINEKEILPAESGIKDPMSNESDEDNSVHLFEDIEVVHPLKANRKSYGKAKKVTFQRSNDSSTSHIPDNRSSDEDDFDLTFQMPNIKQKKITKKKKPKKQLSKKEEKEVEEWAAGFNSMCEDIDEFPLVVE